MHADETLRVAVVGGTAAAALERELEGIDSFELLPAGACSADCRADVVVLVYDAAIKPRTQLATVREHSSAPVVFAAAAHHRARSLGARRGNRRRALAARHARGGDLRDREGCTRRAAQGGRRSAGPRGDGLLAEGRIREVGRRDQPRGRRRGARAQADAPDRPRPAVRRRRDHARAVAEQHGARADRHPDRARRGEARRLHRASLVRCRGPAGAAEPGRGRARGRGGDPLAAERGALGVRPRRRRHRALLLRADARDARPDRPSAVALQPGRADAEERPPDAEDARAALLRRAQAQHRPEPRQPGHHGPGRRRGGARPQGRFRAPARRGRAAGGQPGDARGARGPRVAVLGAMLDLARSVVGGEQWPTGRQAPRAARILSFGRN